MNTIDTTPAHANQTASGVPTGDGSLLTCSLPVIGMMCAACSANVERKLSSLKGISSASVSLPSRTALIVYDPQVISPADMQHEVASIGYDLVIEPERDVEDIERKAYIVLRRHTWLAWLFAVAVMGVSMFFTPHDTTLMLLRNLLLMALALTSISVCGRQFYITAYQQFTHRSANMDTLVALSTAIAFLFSVFNTFWGDMVWTSRGITNSVWFDATTMITAFVLTGRLLEERAKGGTASSIRSLMGLAPKTAHLVTDGELSDVPIATIRPRDMLEVRTGEKVPVDGIIRQGEAFIDESMISGEPIPVAKKKGDRVLAGTLMRQGTMVMRATEVGDKTVLSNIIRMVKQAQSSKAPVQRIVDKVALVFVPTVVGLSLITFLTWLLVGGLNELPHALLSAVSVLVIACPCALGLATPTALMVGIGKAAQHNILIKDATALEQLHHIDSLVIDKTGTLTIPNPDIDFTQADNTLSFEQRESLKPHAAEAIHSLSQYGINIYLMSGDHEEAVAYWAKQAGITHYQSHVTPQDKEDLVRQLQSDRHTVAMIGDGINDSQALAAADVSIAIARGTDVAMEVSQITLMGDDLRRISDAIRISRQTVRTIRQNLFWAVIYNIICIPIAAGVLYPFTHFQLTPMLASALMAMSSVSVVLNSLRIKYL